jgi:hypothetical protein
MRQCATVGLFVVSCLFLVPFSAAGQGTSAASIAGVVRDPSGAVLPGVTVEAASPVLIEKVRSTVTDGDGQYKILELRPGTYSVTFTLPGFSTLKRDGVDLAPNFTATINAVLTVGALEETITVSGESPLVDTQNVTQQKAITNQLLDAVPTPKSMIGLATLMPAATQAPSTQDVGGSRGESSTRISVHGGRPDDAAMMLDGMSFNRVAAPNGRGMNINPLAAEQILIDSGAGGSAEYTASAAVINIIPRDGSNQFKGTIFASGMNGAMQSDNLTNELVAQGMRTPGKMKAIYDLNAVYGGPIKQDKLWFITSHRRWGRDEQVGNLFNDTNPTGRVFGAPASLWKYSPNLGSPTRAREDQRADNVRFTWQAAKAHKLTFSYDWQHNNAADNFGTLSTGTFAIESVTPWCHWDRLFQSTWTHPSTNRLLFEAGFTYNRDIGDYFKKSCVGLPDGILINDTGLGVTYNGRGSRQYEHQVSMTERLSLSYVAGSHTIKVGTRSLEGFLDNHTYRTSVLPLAYQFNNGVPTQITEFGPTVSNEDALPNLGIFAQDSWGLKRLTINYGVRYEYLRGRSNPDALPATVVTPAGDFPGAGCLPCWHDLNPRVGVAYDLFGNGRTAVKASIGRYVQLQNTGVASAYSPRSTVVGNTTRAWTDTSGDFFPNCDLRNPAANGECGAMANSSFGTIQRRLTADPDWVTGWGKRGYSWTASASVDHELTRGIAVSAGYFRTWFGNFTVLDNKLVTPADYDPYCITAPTDSRLPAGVSSQQICGFYDIKPALFGQVDQMNSLASKFGKYSEVYNGVDVNFAARLPHRINLAGGYNIGNAVNIFLTFPGSTTSGVDRCFVVDSPQDLYHCKTANPYQGRVKLNGSIPLPWDLQAALVYQNLPGPNYAGRLTVPTAQVATSLGRPLAGGTRTVTIDLLPTLGYYLDNRINQLDVRMSKIVKVGSSHVQGNLDVYNFFNGSTVLNMNQVVGPTYLQPTQILPARLFKLSLQVDF